MSRLKFEPEDFEYAVNYLSITEAVETAQKKFDEWLEKQPKIYGQDPFSIHTWNTKHPDWHDTHTARLVDIQKIKPKDCKHEPLVSSDSGRFGTIIPANPICHKCDERIEPIGWKAVE